MTKVKLMAQKAWYTNPNIRCVAFDFKEYFPTRYAEVNGTAGAMAALDQYEKEAKATGQSLCVSVILCRGERSPNGFRAAQTMRYVNLRSEEDAA